MQAPLENVILKKKGASAAVGKQKAFKNFLDTGGINHLRAALTKARVVLCVGEDSRSQMLLQELLRHLPTSGKFWPTHRCLSDNGCGGNRSLLRNSPLPESHE